MLLVFVYPSTLVVFFVVAHDIIINHCFPFAVTIGGPHMCVYHGLELVSVFLSQFAASETPFWFRTVASAKARCLEPVYCHRIPDFVIKSYTAHGLNQNGYIDKESRTTAAARASCGRFCGRHLV